MSRENLCEGMKNMLQIYDLVGEMVLERVKKEKKTGLKRDTIKMIAMMERLLKTAVDSAELVPGTPNDIFKLFGFISEMALNRVKKEKATRLKGKTLKMIALTERLVETLNTISD